MSTMITLTEHTNNGDTEATRTLCIPHDSIRRIHSLGHLQTWVLHDVQSVVNETPKEILDKIREARREDLAMHPWSLFAYNGYVVRTSVPGVIGPDAVPPIDPYALPPRDPAVTY